MGVLGAKNPLPLLVGGDTSKVEDIYNALRGALGTLPGPRDGIEDTWRYARSVVMAEACLDVERAAMQAFPNLATDHIPVYEAILNIVPSAGAPDEERRIAITEAWVLRILTDMPSIAQALQRIDPAFDLEELAYPETTLAMHGKAMPAMGSEAVHGVPSFPNFSDDFILRGNYALAPGQVSPPAAVMVSAERYLNSVLPSWVDFTIYTGDGDGFFLDGGPDDNSLLDQTAFD